MGQILWPKYSKFLSNAYSFTVYWYQDQTIVMLEVSKFSFHIVQWLEVY